jgi:hypothetical protein
MISAPRTALSRTMLTSSREMPPQFHSLMPI